MDTEVWKDIPGYEGAYQVSSLGRVRSLDRVVVTKSGVERRMPGKILSPGQYEKGKGKSHLSVVLGRRKFFPVHHLVLLSFVGPRPTGAVICHNNGNPKDNRLCNLRYDTQRENAKDVYRLGGAMHKLTAEDALSIRTLLAKGVRGADLAREYGVSQSAISRVKHGRSFAWLQ